MSGTSPDVFVIRDAETLKAVSDPLRLKLLGLLQDRAMTVKELAAVLDAAPTRLYYHVNLLESLGLIHVAETRIVAGIIEKHYRASAKRIGVDRALFSPGAAPVDEAIEAMLTAILDGVRDAVRDSVRAGLVDPRRETPAEHGLLLGRRWMRLTTAQADDLYWRLIDTVKAFEDRYRNDAGVDEVSYEMLLGLYPVTSPVENAEQDDKTDA